MGKEKRKWLLSRAHHVPNTLHIFSHLTFTVPYEMSIITSHLQMKKQNQKVKEEFQNLATGVWVEPKSVSRVFAFGSLCSALPPSIQGFCGALWLRASGAGDTEQNSRSEAWVPLKEDHARILTSGSVTKGGTSLKSEQCCWRGFH